MESNSSLWQVDISNLSRLYAEGGVDSALVKLIAERGILLSSIEEEDILQLLLQYSYSDEVKYELFDYLDSLQRDELERAITRLVLQHPLLVAEYMTRLNVATVTVLLRKILGYTMDTERTETILLIAAKLISKGVLSLNDTMSVLLDASEYETASTLDVKKFSYPLSVLVGETIDYKPRFAYYVLLCFAYIYPERLHDTILKILETTKCDDLLAHVTPAYLYIDAPNDVNRVKARLLISIIEVCGDELDVSALRPSMRQLIRGLDVV